jgi:glycosyltransferase involved in cell wall biosynthesis
MRLLFVVQRYGTDVAGGSEAACREMATRLATRDHDVHVLTSCAQSYVDWADAYPPGESELEGVLVHRLSVSHPREARFFGPMNERIVFGRKPVPLSLQREWMRMQGPEMPQLAPWLTEHAAGYDAVVFFTYLYYSTWAGLPIAAGLTPTVLHPTAHDEPPIYLPLFDFTFRLPTALGYLTEEEERFVERRFRMKRPSAVIGLGVDLDVDTDEADFRRRFKVGDRPYLLYVGRLDPDKGSDELYGHFTAYKARNPGPLALVVVGEPVKPMPAHPDVICTGWVDERIKASAIAGCLSLVQPSYYESFSLVLAEAWAQSKPAIVQANCEVLAGQARRSAAAIPYSGFAQFEVAVDMLLNEPRLREEFGERGRRFVERRYQWSSVLDREEHLLRTASHLFRQATSSVTSGAQLRALP